MPCSRPAAGGPARTRRARFIVSRRVVAGPGLPQRQRPGRLPAIGWRSTAGRRSFGAHLPRLSLIHTYLICAPSSHRYATQPSDITPCALLPLMLCPHPSTASGTSQALDFYRSCNSCLLRPVACHTANFAAELDLLLTISQLSVSHIDEQRAALWHGFSRPLSLVQSARPPYPRPPHPPAGVWLRASVTVGADARRDAAGLVEPALPPHVGSFLVPPPVPPTALPRPPPQRLAVRRHTVAPRMGVGGAAQVGRYFEWVSRQAAKA